MPPSAQVRANFIAALNPQNAHVQDFLNFVDRHDDRADPFNFKEFFDLLPKNSHDAVWMLTLQYIVKIISAGEHYDESDITTQNALAFLRGVCKMAMHYIADDKATLPTPLLQTVQCLHDTLFDVDIRGRDLQHDIAALCELWWDKNLPEKETIIFQVITYLFLAALDTNGSSAGAFLLTFAVFSFTRVLLCASVCIRYIYFLSFFSSFSLLSFFLPSFSLLSLFILPSFISYDTMFLQPTHATQPTRH